MKKFILLFVFSISYLTNAQEFKIQYYLKKETSITSQTYKTDLIITPTTITLKNFYGNKTEDVIRKIDKIETKPYWDIDCIWYYCTDIEKDIISNDYRKSIFIYNGIKKNIVFADFATEIDVQWFKFSF